ncbi:hypothetical protein GP486_005157 [Trichoglossum hirsutum]|uniref:VWFA domain-containing protein n=1 Tax=Trichoglossum hirsutum TaxID=265104 RepID=A0A9P8L9R0_9PEZI|nr:hypothetical protein GP486_005157 [Trichoglossum hirsutum]
MFTASHHDDVQKTIRDILKNPSDDREKQRRFYTSYGTRGSQNSYIHHVEPEEVKSLRRLQERDTVFIIDDTPSMQARANCDDVNSQTHWDMLTDALRHITDIAAKWATNGVDVRFLIDNHLNRSVKNVPTILDLLSQVDLERGEGGTLMPYLSRYVENRGSPQISNPLNVITITDSSADDPLETELLLEKVARQLGTARAPRFQIGIQLVQIGDDGETTRCLKDLDDRLEKKDRNVG